jgi:hypothetical protein
MTTVELLKAAKAKIADEKHWTREAWARDEGGVKIDEGHPDARQWCAVGALYLVGDFPKAAAARLILDQVATEGRGIFDVNDRLGHDAVMRAYDKAIELASEKGQP